MKRIETTINDSESSSLYWCVLHTLCFGLYKLGLQVCVWIGTVFHALSVFVWIWINLEKKNCVLVSESDSDCKL